MSSAPLTPDEQGRVPLTTSDQLRDESRSLGTFAELYLSAPASKRRVFSAAHALAFAAARIEVLEVHAAELEARAERAERQVADLTDDACSLAGQLEHLDAAALRDVARERARQTARWGEQEHPDGTGERAWVDAAEAHRAACETADPCTWRHILMEEVAEALAESGPERLRAELVQVAAVAVQWVEAIDRRGGR